MLYLDIQNCEEKQYKALLDYIFSLCNKVSFHLPNFQSSGTNSIKINKNGEKNLEYIEYLNKNKKILDLCYQKGAKKYISNIFISRKLSYNTQVISVDLFFELKQLLIKHHLFEWQYPDLPEDVSFFSNNTCKFYTIAHDEFFIIPNETKEDLNFLNSYKIEYMNIRNKK